MVEIDLRKNYLWNGGYPREDDLIERELYRLLSVFAASPELSRRRSTCEDDVDLNLYTKVIQQFEYTELSRILLFVAVTIRNQWDNDRDKHERFVKMGNGTTVVGELYRDVEDSSVDPEPLVLLESFNKVIHATHVNLDRSEAGSITSGHLEPRVYLYGEHRHKFWQATIEIYSWAEAIYCVS